MNTHKPALGCHCQHSAPVGHGGKLHVPQNKPGNQTIQSRRAPSIPSHPSINRVHRHDKSNDIGSMECFKNSPGL
ncbi:hypothetical protein BB560_005488 [Smittium megazygosporum]|uniref:Uncharacterized protein n=1 Tax=Smittium megazygosporum TaxID=133381 RepID=A0A2T9Z4I3_9FUNG|nr:hypothetical protein BB560_005488 [Smittium megazygosporum]